MPIITFTTDFGIIDNYVAIVKGAILCKKPDLNIIDISHNIKKHDIVQAAYLLKHAYHHFPKGSIHIVSVKERYSHDIEFVLIKHNGHYFIGPDNGLFSLILDDVPTDIFLIDKGLEEVFPLPSVAAKAIGHLLNGDDPAAFGEVRSTIEKRLVIQPVIGQNHMRGTVILVDDFGNAIVNIQKDAFEKARDGREFAIYVKRKSPITQLSTHYLSENIGDILALFNSTDYLEIAISMGNASTLLDVHPEDTIQIDFYNAIA